MAAPQPAIGIDLGTTLTVVARLDDTGQPRTVTNAEGDLSTPSVVLLEGDSVIVGKEALKALSTEPERVGEAAKRDMGARAFHAAIDGRTFAPEVLQAFVLRKAVRDAAQQLGPIEAAVVTVPAYFDEARRKATEDAGYMAGIEVLDIINEPTAAALAFGMQQGFLDAQGRSQARQRLVVYDLGGGTFDVTIMEIEGTDFRALATDGDVLLGGRDWDERLLAHAAERFVAEHGLDPRDDPASRARLWRDCEDAKRTLSARPKALITVDHRGLATRVEVTREQFDELTRDLVERTRFTTRQALSAAGLDWSTVDRVLLVGGSSRMPMIRDMLRQLSGKEPDAVLSPDEAVAQGAALHAGRILATRAGQRPRFRIRDVNSHSLGVAATDPQTRLVRNAVVIPRNTPLPVTARREFQPRVAGQGTIEVRILEGESQSADGCTSIGRCVVRDLPAGLPKETAIRVAFHYESNGRLTVDVEVSQTGTKLRHELVRDNGLPAEELDAWRARIAAGLVV